MPKDPSIVSDDLSDSNYDYIVNVDDYLLDNSDAAIIEKLIPFEMDSNITPSEANQLKSEEIKYARAPFDPMTKDSNNITENAMEGKYVFANDTPIHIDFIEDGHSNFEYNAGISSENANLSFQRTERKNEFLMKSYTFAPMDTTSINNYIALPKISTTEAMEDKDPEFGSHGKHHLVEDKKPQNRSKTLIMQEIHENKKRKRKFSKSLSDNFVGSTTVVYENASTSTTSHAVLRSREKSFLPEVFKSKLTKSQSLNKEAASRANGKRSFDIASKDALENTSISLATLSSISETSEQTQSALKTPSYEFENDRDNSTELDILNSHIPTIQTKGEHGVHYHKDKRKLTGPNLNSNLTSTSLVSFFDSDYVNGILNNSRISQQKNDVFTNRILKDVKIEEVTDSNSLLKSNTSDTNQFYIEASTETYKLEVSDIENRLDSIYKPFESELYDDLGSVENNHNVENENVTLPIEKSNSDSKDFTSPVPISKSQTIIVGIKNSDDTFTENSSDSTPPLINGNIDTTQRHFKDSGILDETSIMVESTMSFHFKDIMLTAPALPYSSESKPYNDEIGLQQLARTTNLPSIVGDQNTLENGPKVIKNISYSHENQENTEFMLDTRNEEPKNKESPSLFTTDKSIDSSINKSALDVRALFDVSQSYTKKEHVHSSTDNNPLYTTPINFALVSPITTPLPIETQQVSNDQANLVGTIVSSEVSWGSTTSSTNPSSKSYQQSNISTTVTHHLSTEIESKVLPDPLDMNQVKSSEPPPDWIMEPETTSPFATSLNCHTLPRKHSLEGEQCR